MEHAHYEVIKFCDMEYSIEGQMLHYPCPCGDIFELTLSDFAAGSDVAQCPVCSLTIQIDVSDAERKAFLAKHLPSSPPVSG